MNARKRLPLWCAVPGGVLAGHAVAYLIAFPDEAGRASFLAAAGHSYLRHAVLIAILGGAIALTLAVARAARTTWRAAAVRVCALQIGTFIGVEMLERVAVGLHPTDGLARIALIGTFVQLVMGAVVAFVLGLANRAGRTIASVLATRPSAAKEPRARIAFASSPIGSSFLALARRPRGPPSLLGSSTR